MLVSKYVTRVWLRWIHTQRIIVTSWLQRMLSLHIASRMLPIAKCIHRKCIINGHSYRFHWNVSVITQAFCTASRRTLRTGLAYESLHLAACVSSILLVLVHFQMNLQLCKFESIDLTAFTTIYWNAVPLKPVGDLRMFAKTIYPSFIQALEGLKTVS